MIEAFGGRVTSAVSGKTDYLVVGAEPGASKVAKAQEKGIPMLDVKTLKAVLESPGARLESAPRAVITSYSKGFRGNAISDRLMAAGKLPELRAEEEEEEEEVERDTSHLGGEIEPARSGRSTCKVCHRLIGMGELRCAAAQRSRSLLHRARADLRSRAQRAVGAGRTTSRAKTIRPMATFSRCRRPPPPPSVHFPTTKKGAQAPPALSSRLTAAWRGRNPLQSWSHLGCTSFPINGCASVDELRGFSHLGQREQASVRAAIAAGEQQRMLAAKEEDGDEDAEDEDEEEEEEEEEPEEKPPKEVAKKRKAAAVVKEEPAEPKAKKAKAEAAKPKAKAKAEAAPAALTAAAAVKKEVKGSPPASTALAAVIVPAAGARAGSRARAAPKRFGGGAAGE